MQGVFQGEEKNITIKSLLEKTPYTILYFYPKNDTPGCTVEAQDFTKFSKEFNDLGYQIIGVSRDSIESHCAFIEKYSLSPSYISDPDLELHKAHGAWGEKNNYGKIVQGVIRSTIILDQKGNIVKQWNNVRAKGHAQRVLSFVSQDA